MQILVEALDDICNWADRELKENRGRGNGDIKGDECIWGWGEEVQFHARDFDYAAYDFMKFKYEGKLFCSLQ